jgi:hypothetical protein
MERKCNRDEIRLQNSTGEMERRKNVENLSVGGRKLSNSE